ncbi:MAG TPA: hypothetical protein VNA25_15320 [Phycisphaerae bacterium]|nr:hypothetical protein [Phycisphaerae bacterium]
MYTDWGPEVWIWIAIGAVALILLRLAFPVIRLARSFARMHRVRRLQAWAAARGLSFTSASSGDLAGRFPEFDWSFPLVGSLTFSVMEGQWQGQSFIGFDQYQLREGLDGESPKHVLSGVILSSSVPLKPLLIRPQALADKVAAALGWEDINLESAEFSRRFHVSAPDRRWAYDVIHPRTMELLLASPPFCVRFGLVHAMAYRTRPLRPRDFELAAELLRGILDGLPDYVVRQQMGQG